MSQALGVIVKLYNEICSRAYFKRFQVVGHFEGEKIEVL